MNKTAFMIVVIAVLTNLVLVDVVKWWAAALVTIVAFIILRRIGNAEE